MGGDTARDSLSAGWSGGAFGGDLSANAYVIRCRPALYSNFTYFLDDPVNGDQFRQSDERRVHGASLSQQWEHRRNRWRVGAVLRVDDIGRVDLYRTRARALLSTVREDAVRESSVGMFVAHELQFEPHWRSYLTLRQDWFDFDVDARSLPVNSGAVSELLFVGDAGTTEPSRPIPLVVAAGLTARSEHGWTGTVRLRHFGAYPLEERGVAR